MNLDEKKSELRALAAGTSTLFSHGYNARVKAFGLSIQANTATVVKVAQHLTAMLLSGAIEWEESDAALRIQSSCDEMVRFLSGMQRPYLRALTLTNHGPDSTIEVAWHDGLVGRVLWDRWTVDLEDPAIVFSEIAYAFDRIDYRCGPKAKTADLPPLYRYHPERFKAARRYAGDVGNFYRRRVDAASGMMTVDQLNDCMRLVMLEMNKRSMSFPRKIKNSYPEPSFVIDAEHVLATAYGRFVQAGCQIMDFPPSLIEMFRTTDVDDIPLNAIKLPYASQYLHFGAQEDLVLEPGWRVDGAYVEQRGPGGNVRFTITTVADEPRRQGRWFLDPEPQYTQDFVGEFSMMDLGTAIDTSLSDMLSGFAKVKAMQGGDITNEIREGLEDQADAMPEGVTVVNSGPRNAEIREAETLRRHPIYVTALRLVVNALCYLSAYPDDIESAWPAGTPEALKIKAETRLGKEQARAQSKLAALGYVPVHVCGKRVAEEREKAGFAGAGQGHANAHWRRGHWRNQVHGPARSLRKLIWVMPVVVRGVAGTEPALGHLYLVS